MLKSLCLLIYQITIQLDMVTIIVYLNIAPATHTSGFSNKARLNKICHRKQNPQMTNGQRKHWLVDNPTINHLCVTHPMIYLSINHYTINNQVRFHNREALWTSYINELYEGHLGCCVHGLKVANPYATFTKITHS